MLKGYSLGANRYRVASMRDVERAIENVLSERIAVSQRVDWNPVRRLEDFTLNNLIIRGVNVIINRRFNSLHLKRR